MKKILFLDRDGTILKEPSDLQIDSVDKFALLPGVISSLRRCVLHGYSLVMVSNQDGLGTISFPTETFEPCQRLMIDLLKSEGIVFEEIFIDPHFEKDNHPNRKPNLGMLLSFLSKHSIDKKKSFVIGDRLIDAMLAKNIGCGSLTISLSDTASGEEKKTWSQIDTLVFASWKEIVDHLLNQPRQVEVQRETKETSIKMKLLLEGQGHFSGKTGLNFFDHMLEQIVRHSGIDLWLEVKGDLEVDEHHTIEDVGICLGWALKEALGDKRGIQRYGFLLPMDDSLAECAIDLSNRAYFKFEGKFNREYVGDFPVEMLTHFFHSLAASAEINLHLKVEGENTHHQIEACFKAFARSLRQAIYRLKPADLPTDENNLSSMLPSTKENL